MLRALATLDGGAISLFSQAIPSFNPRVATPGEFLGIYG